MLTEKQIIHDDNGWNQLYKIGVWGAYLSLAIIPLSVVAFFIWPPFPDNIVEIIAGSKFAGLMSLDFLYLVGNFFAIPIYLVLFVTLFKTNKSLSVLSLAFGFIGFISLTIARPTFELINLVGQYQAAVSLVQKEQILTSFHVLLAYSHGTSFSIHYIIGTLSLLLSAIIMLKSDIYSKSTAYVGIATCIFTFTYYVPVIGVYLSLLSVVGYTVWWAKLGRTFRQISRA